MEMGRKKLIEVSMPLNAINRASTREKSIRHGHPSTLDLWWARRPVAACRLRNPDDEAMLLSSTQIARLHFLFSIAPTDALRRAPPSVGPYPS